MAADDHLGEPADVVGEGVEVRARRSHVLHSGLVVGIAAVGGEKHRRPRDDVGQVVNKARDAGRVPDKDLTENERQELERLRKENAVLRMERDFAKK